MKTVHLQSGGMLTVDLLQFVLLNASILLLAGEFVQGADCVQWIKRTDVGSYGQRWQHAMAYDSDRGVTVFFGGDIGAGHAGERTYFNDTQEYDGKQWKQINTAVKPPRRSHHAMAYDPVRKKIVMFGGWFATGGDDIGEPIDVTYYSDTWLYTSDGVTGFWEPQPQAANVAPRYEHGMIWDSSDHVVLLLGGFGGAAGWDPEPGHGMAQAGPVAYPARFARVSGWPSIRNAQRQ